MYHGSSGEQHLASTKMEACQGKAAPTSSSNGHKSTSYPTYTNDIQHHNSQNMPLTAAEDDWDYEERHFHTGVQGRMSLGMERGYPTPPRSSYSSPPVMDQGHSWEATSHHSYGPPRSATSLPPVLEAYNNDGQHLMNPFPGAFPYHYDQTAHAEYPNRPAASSSSHGYFTTTPLHEEADNALFGISAPHHRPGHRSSHPAEMLPNFPQWSRTWYDGHLSSNGHAYTSVPPPAGQTGWESDSYSRSGHSGAVGGTPYGYHQGRRDRFDIVKEERLRMLEREFGKPRTSSRKGRRDYEGDTSQGSIGDDEDLALGSVTSTGRLVTERPKTMLAVRCVVGLTTLAGCLCGLGGALLVKTTSADKPAPQGTLPAYLLYGCSTVTLLLLLYLYVFRPCCCDPMRKEVKSNATSGNPLAGMVIPVLSGGPGGKPGKKQKFGKRGFQQQQQSPTVNLIVDPAFFSGKAGGKGINDEDGEDDDDDEGDRLPGDARRSKKRKHGLGVLGNMQMQRRWQLARSKVKLHTTWDVILLLLWIACGIVCLGLGKKCPAAAGAWCTFYNVALACGVINAVFLTAALYLNYRVLKISRHAPKPPM